MTLGRIPLILLIIFAAVVLPLVALADSVTVKVIDFDVEVKESIIIDVNTINVTLFPGESSEKTIQITNISNIDVDIEIHTSVEAGPGLSVEVDSGRNDDDDNNDDGRAAIRVPGGATVDVDVLISAANDAAVGRATVHIDIQRE